MKGVFAASLVFLLEACQSGPPPVSEEEKDAIMSTYIACLHGAARELDDHTSDASSVAIGVAQRCTSEFNATVDVESRGMSPYEKVLFTRKVQPQALGTATTAVLEERNRKMH